MNLIVFVLTISMLLVLATAVKLRATQSGVDRPSVGLGRILAEIAKVEEPWYLDQTYRHENRLAQNDPTGGMMGPGGSGGRGGGASTKQNRKD